MSPPNRKPRGPKNEADRSTRRRKVASRRGREEPEEKKKYGQPRSAPAPIMEEVRLNRFIAQTGIASRRKADELISEGRVQVNGAVVTELGARVGPKDDVVVDGKPIRPQSLHYILLNKPDKTITTKSDEKGRATVLDLLDEDARVAGVFPVGRLDRHTTGVLLLTNDGELAHRLMHPRYVVDKMYLVETIDSIKPDQIDRLRTGIELEDGEAKADQVGYPDEGNRRQIVVQIHEGRNRQVRRMLEALGHEVKSLERVQYAGLSSEGLRRGRWRRLAPHEVNHLRRMVKLKKIVF
jgi:23S rRNA pseudouridine2605 synthase